MIKRIIALVLAFSFVFAMSSCAKTNSSEDKTLTIYTWDGMFPDEVIDGFEEETGIKVNYVTFDTDETMLAKLEASNGEYDLIIADDYIIETAISEGLVEKLDKDKISNYSNINSSFQGQFYDKNDEYTVPFGAGIVQIAYDASKVDIDIKGYSDLFDPSLEGRVGIVGNSRVVIGLMQKMLGYSMNTENENEIRKAGEKLLKLAPNINIINDSYLNENLISGDVDVALVYQSQATLACLSSNDIVTVLPKEGLGFGVMAMFIPSNAHSKDAAHKFIDYTLDGEVGAKCFEWMGYYSTNTAADDCIALEYKAFLTVPENVNLDNAEIVQNISQEASDIQQEVWDNFVAACS